MNEIDYERLFRSGNNNESAKLRDEVLAAHHKQRSRYKSLNAKLSNKDLKSIATLNDDAKLLLDNAAAKLQLSARSYIKIVKIARTIADLNLEDNISTSHIAEALQFRPKISTL